MTLPRNLAAALRRFPLDARRVLEPACGRGRYLRHFGPGSVGLDRDAGVLRDCAEAPFEVRPADLDAPGWSAGLAGFEAAFLNDVLMHVADPPAFLAELRGTLAPGAPVFLVEWCLPGRPLADALAKRVPGARGVFGTPEHLRVFTRADIEALVSAEGYRVVATWLHTFDAAGGPLAPLARGLAPLARPFWPVQTWQLV